MNQNFKTKQAEIQSTQPNSKKMETFIGSSETTRDLQLSTFDFADYQKLGRPQHKPALDIVFLEWFIGFFEAEGCLQCWKNEESIDLPLK